MIFVGPAATTRISVAVANIKRELELPPMPGEHLFPLFRSALQSQGDVERFMHLYNIVLMLHGDSQQKVDEFIRNEQPTGLPPETTNPKTGNPETVYTRLRNEFAHARKGRTDDLSPTKREIGERVGRFVQLARKAIETKG